MKELHYRCAIHPWGAWWDSNPRISESQPEVLTAWRQAPYILGRSWGIRTPNLWFRRPTIYPIDIKDRIPYRNTLGSPYNHVPVNSGCTWNESSGSPWLFVSVNSDWKCVLIYYHIETHWLLLVIVFNYLSVAVDQCVFIWYTIRESNPSYQRERLVS